MFNMQPDFNSLVLTRHDHDFITRIINDITEDGLLPFSLPPMSIPRLIKDSAQYFYEEDDDSVEERWYIIRQADANRDISMNNVIQLPLAIESVFEIFQTTSHNQFTNVSKFLREPLLYGPMNANISSGSGSGLTGHANYADLSEFYQQGIISLWASSQDKSQFQKGIRFDYNRNTHRLNLLGAFTGDLVLSVFQRIPLADGLYNDRLFYKHVKASAYERLKKILALMDFQYPGDVKINFDDLSAMGRESREKVEEDIAERSSGADLFIVT